MTLSHGLTLGPQLIDVHNIINVIGKRNILIDLNVNSKLPLEKCE